MSGLRNIDVHLLVTLDHLLRERSVTEAARRLGVTQPAVSASLAKLRRHFGDPLLVRQGHGYVLTPLAESLGERMPGMLADLRSVLDAEHGFDPATTQRTFALVASDHFAAVYGQLLVRHVKESAPRASIRFVGIAGPPTGDGATTLREVDGLVLPRASLIDLPCIDIARDEWALVIGAEAAAPVTVEDLATRDWVTFRGWGAGHIPPVEFLLSQGIELPLAVMTADFGSIPFLVAGTERIGIMPRRHAVRLAEAAGVVVLPAPVALPDLVLSVVWDSSWSTDPGHAWFRRALTAFARDLRESGWVDSP